MSPRVQTAITKAKNDCSSTNITTSAYVQLIAAVGTGINQIEVYNPTTKVLILAVGAAGSEVDLCYLFPTAVKETHRVWIEGGKRISVKADASNATTGILYVNLFGA